MHIDQTEALAILEVWRNAETSLDTSLYRSKTTQKVSAKISEIRGTIIVLLSQGNTVEIDLVGAEFNGDRRGPVRASHGPYLVCEFRNDDRVTFYAPRTEAVLTTERRSK